MPERALAVSHIVMPLPLVHISVVPPIYTVAVSLLLIRVRIELYLTLINSRIVTYFQIVDNGKRLIGDHLIFKGI